MKGLTEHGGFRFRCDGKGIGVLDFHLVFVLSSVTGWRNGDRGGLERRFRGMGIADGREILVMSEFGDVLSVFAEKDQNALEGLSGIVDAQAEIHIALVGNCHENAPFSWLTVGRLSTERKGALQKIRDPARRDSRNCRPPENRRCVRRDDPSSRRSRGSRR